MNNNTLQVPVLLITFNRPDVTKIVLDRILEVNPPKIYFFNDAPRKGNENDRIKCQEVRDLIHQISYQGEMITRFEEKNLGCKGGESTAMGWLFENEEMGIVIEDDVYPNHDFFFFCQEMLHKYRYDDRIYSVGGCNLLNEWKPEDHDYFYTQYGSFWGWAGWQRVWKKYNVAMPEWNDPKVKELVLQAIPTNEYKLLRGREFDALVSGENDTWDFQFCFYQYLYHGICIAPARNMVENIGTNRADAVHMVGESPYSELKIFPKPEKIRDNPFMVVDYRYDVACIQKSHPYFFEEPVYPPHPEPKLGHKITMSIGKMIGKKGPLRQILNLLQGK